MKKTINDKHKAVVDEYFINGFNKIKAYESEYEVKGTAASRGFYKMTLKEDVKDYFLSCQKDLAASIGLSKEVLVGTLSKDIESYHLFVDLANKDSLTEKEEKKFNRLKEVYSHNSKTKSLELIAKLLGLFEPEKIEVKSINYTVDFGGKKDQ
tara:strand:+ start:140 stop:598 length:459 start_codon:yes stop_codon:yes gene_type:complete